MPIVTKISPTLTNRDSDSLSPSSEDPLSGSLSSNPRTSDEFLCVLFAHVLFSIDGENLNRVQRRLNPLAWIDQPIKVKDETEEEFIDDL